MKKLQIIVIILLLVGIAVQIKRIYMNEETNRRLTDLEQKVSQMDAQRLTYPLDAVSSKVVERATDDFLPDKIYDLIWKKVFYYFTSFESLAGFNVAVSGTGSVVATADKVTITTAATNGNLAELSKGYLNFGLATFNQKSSFRTSFSFNATPTNLTSYIVVGTVSATGTSYYGFKIINNILYGVSSKNGTTGELAIQLLTGLTTDIYNIEAQYIPSTSVSFRTTSLTLQTTRGVISTTLPSPSAVVNSNIMDIQLTANEAVAKSLTVSFFEFLQFRNILK